MSDCPHCASFAAENGQLTEEVSALTFLTRKQALSEQALRRELKQLRRSDPLAQDITAILKLWRALCSTKRSSIDLDGDRAKVVRAALKSKVTGDRKEKRRMCMDAVRGLALRPYVVNAQRKGAGRPEQRYAKIEHALGDEGRIEDHASFYRMALGSSLEWKDAAWAAARSAEDRWMDLYVQAVFEESRAQRKAVAALPVRPHLFVVPTPEVEAA
jgi:hypothetical protein